MFAVEYPQRQDAVLEEESRIVLLLGDPELRTHKEISVRNLRKILQP